MVAPCAKNSEHGRVIYFELEGENFLRVNNSVLLLSRVPTAFILAGSQQQIRLMTLRRVSSH